MSHVFKINSAWLTVVGSALATAVTVIWMASSKASDIDTAKEDIRELKASDRSTTQTLSRLVERSEMILRELENLNAKLKP